MKYDNRAILAGFQAADAARRRALMQRLSGKPAKLTPEERIQQAVKELHAALQAVKDSEA